MTAAAAPPPPARPAIARPRRDLGPLLLVPALALLALPLVGSVPTWATLTVAGLAMGMMIFLMASGLTLIFGLMDVLNFGHGGFITIGGYVAALVLLPLAPWSAADSVWLNLAVLALAALAAALATGAVGLVFERLLVRPVYGQHLKQILITMGGLIVAEQLIILAWGPNQIPLPLPTTLRGAVVVGSSAIERYRLVAVVVGLAVFAGMQAVLGGTRVGLLIRAGVENAEMVEALGYRIRRLFVGVFMAGAGLAGLGGTLWALYRTELTAHMGTEVMVLVFIVVIIGGLGSVGGCFLGALAVALVANYTGYAAPKLALGSNILLMVAILMWRPRGLYPLSRR